MKYRIDIFEWTDKVCATGYELIFSKNDLNHEKKRGYGITGKQDPLDIATMQRQLNALDTKLEETVALSQKSGGDPQKLMNVVSELCRQMTVLRERIDAAKANVEADNNLNFEIKRITELLENSTTTEFDDSAIRMLVETIRVMTDGKIQIELKTGETIIEALDPTDDEM